MDIAYRQRASSFPVLLREAVEASGETWNQICVAARIGRTTLWRLLNGIGSVSASLVGRLEVVLKAQLVDEDTMQRVPAQEREDLQTLKEWGLKGRREAVKEADKLANQLWRAERDLEELKKEYDALMEKCYDYNKAARESEEAARELEFEMDKAMRWGYRRMEAMQDCPPELRSQVIAHPTWDSGLVEYRLLEVLEDIRAEYHRNKGNGSKKSKVKKAVKTGGGTGFGAKA